MQAATRKSVSKVVDVTRRSVLGAQRSVVGVTRRSMMKIVVVTKKRAKTQLTYFRLHLAYFITMSLLGTWILWSTGAKNSSRRHFRFIDCFYSITSALCITGLSCLPIEDIPTSGQVVLMLMMILGGQVVTSVVPLFVKRHRYYDVAKQALGSESGSEDVITSSPREPGRKLSLLKRLGTFNLRSKPNKDDQWMREMASRKHAEHLQAIFQEHQATIALIRIVILYYVIVHLIGFLVAWGCIMGSPHAKRILKQRKVNPGFFALFATVSAFANAGLILVNENMVLLNTSTLLLLTLVALIFLGNTMFAPALRGIIWLLHRYGPSSRKQIYKFLLDHPRKCFTHLFPHRTTLWLVLAVTTFNGFECLMFYALDWKSKALAALRTGMNSINLADLSPSMLFLYCGMMYIAAYPVFLSRQHSRHQDKDLVGKPLMEKDRDIYDTTISTQSRRLLAQDWAYLFFSIFFICVSESRQLKGDPRNYTIFSVIFEVISAYGNVGLTLGYNCSLRIDTQPCVDVPFSFSGTWGVIGKLFIIVVMFLGRHRGLPDNIDSAIVLPEERFYMMVRTQTLEQQRQQQQQKQKQQQDGESAEAGPTPQRPPPRSECTDISS